MPHSGWKIQVKWKDTHYSVILKNWNLIKTIRKSREFFIYDSIDLLLVLCCESGEENNYSAQKWSTLFFENDDGLEYTSLLLLLLSVLRRSSPKKYTQILQGRRKDEKLPNRNGSQTPKIQKLICSSETKIPLNVMHDLGNTTITLMPSGIPCQLSQSFSLSHSFPFNMHVKAVPNMLACIFC